MAELLSGASNQLALSLIPEPQLVFADKQICEDPKTGLSAFGPYSKTDATRKTVIRVGIVGPAEAIDRAWQLIERMGSPIPFSEKLDAMLHPGFPGICDKNPFQIQFVTQSVWCRRLTPNQTATVENHPDFPTRIRLLVDAVTEQVKALADQDSGPDVVLIAMTAGLEKQCRVGIAAHDKALRDAANQDDEGEDAIADIIEEVDEDVEPEEGEDEILPASERPDTARSFRRGLKAECMQYLPTQLLWNRTLAGTKGVQTSQHELGIYPLH